MSSQGLKLLRAYEKLRLWRAELLIKLLDVNIVHMLIRVNGKLRLFKCHGVVRKCHLLDRKYGLIV